jgi:HlyD family secretion protein
VITTVAVAGGDTITTDDSLITLNAWDDVTMEATVSEDDIGSVVVDDTVNITLDSFADTAFTGVITEIADAVTDSSTGEITYAVTVTLQGDVSQLYEGMTGDITFITKESEQVVYIANRAVIRDGSKSYVKIKDSDGSVMKQEVTTGFSDGINVEITEGLSEGDIVLIESKVSE